jgi:hypothetical protein
MTTSTLFRNIDERAVTGLLGMPERVPLTPSAMASRLRVTFYPVNSASDRVRAFTLRLEAALAACGVMVLGYNEALADPKRGKLREGLVVIAAGDLATGDLPVDHVANLRSATIVGVVDGPCPAEREEGLQEKLNSVVKTLAWSIVQVVIFVDDSAWTVCTMNGAIVRIPAADSFERRVFSILVPKLAAPVVPPRATDFDLHEGALDIATNGCSRYADDFAASGPSWAQTGLMLFHTSVESLEFRNRYYQRIAAAYLDHRSGMSYGFLARQLPVDVHPALRPEEAVLRPELGQILQERWARVGRETYVVVTVKGQELVARVPEVRMLTTRSGCDKSNIDIHRDIVLLALESGTIRFETPNGMSAVVDCKPSYDTVTILAHAAGNAIVASVLARLDPAAAFPRLLGTQGAALAHWHGRIDPSILPRGYLLHGDSNPPVSCSTHQSAVYALTGKLAALEAAIRIGVDFAGDVHIEPYHGTNITGATLTELSRWVLDCIEAHGVTQFAVQDALPAS